MSEARPHKHYYRRNLPHFQGDGAPIFITFATRDHWILPEKVRGEVLEHCRHDHGKKINLYCAVVMPDHVHMIYELLPDEDGKYYGLTEILSGVKGASAHSVNRMLGRKGRVWMDESFDHVIRSWESLQEKIEYLMANPVRKELCERPAEYPWLWLREGL